MAASIQRQVPGTPRVISPSPTPSESGGDSYFAPVTRSAARRSTRISSPPAINEGEQSSPSSSDSEGRARSRSRSRDATLRKRGGAGFATMTALDEKSSTMTTPKLSKKRPNGNTVNGTSNGHLSPASVAKYYWRELSRSPSPLGLIPIHKSWRSFIHRHEVPRKFLHVSIGFLTLGLYAIGSQTSSIHPVLLACLIPIALTDLLRHNWPPFNRFYVGCLGPFMRETEVHERYNGVIWYLLGAWAVLRFCSKDIGVMSVILLSWCDTAASTFGRLWGRYTPRIRKGKSLAGSIAAFIVGVGAAIFFWGWFARRFETMGIADNTGANSFSFQGRLTLPEPVRNLLGWTVRQSTVTGGLALGIMSIWTGLAVSVSEAIDIYNFDDNVTIPVLCGIGLWGFLKVFGGA